MLTEQPRTKGERYREILGTLARHGIGVVEDELVKHEPDREQSRAEHLRQACEELGTMFIKLGQMLSTRGDVLPEAYRTELAKLEDHVPALPVAFIAAVIRDDLGASTDELFAFFDDKPMGSASIGQVHSARLFDGREVVVKVRKPGVQKLVQMDLEILADLIEEWAPHFPVLQQYDARGLLREFSDTMLAELDFRHEATNEKYFHDLFAKEQGFIIPCVIEACSKERVLTHERIDGKRANDVASLPTQSRAALSRRIARFVLEPAFEHGVFYADPHPGNLLVQEDGSLGVIDFGMVGRLTPETRERVANMFMAIGRCDAERLVDGLVEVIAPTQPVDRAVITTEVGRLLERYVGESFENVPLGDAIGELLQLLRGHRLRLPANLAELFKALAMCEGVLRGMDPDSSLADYLQPMARKLVYAGVTGDNVVDRLRDSVVDAAELTLDLPRRIDRVLGEIERGNLRVWTRVEDVESLVKRFERMVERLNATMLAAACIVALAVVMQFYHPQGWQQWIGTVFWIAVAAAVIDAVRTLLGLRK